MNQMKNRGLKFGLKYLSVLACGAWALGAGPSGAPGGITQARAQSAVAMVIGVKGSPQLDVGGRISKLRLGARLVGGSVVKCAPNSEATIVLFLSGNRFRVPAGALATVSANNITGASALSAAGKVSPLVARALAGSRTGAFTSRTAGGYGLFSLLPPNEVANTTASRPELGFLVKGTSQFDLPWPAGTQVALFTLYDSESDVAYSERLSTPRVSLPRDFAPSLRRSYVWSVVPFTGTNLSSPTELRRETPQWGMVTWLSEGDARLVNDAIGTASLDSLSAGDNETATLASGVLQEHKVNGGAWKLLSGLRNKKLEGAEDAFFEFYKTTPRIAQFFSGYSSEFSAWEMKP